LKPGASGTINVIFGYTYGHKPGYPIKGDNIPQILLFTDKVKEPASFRVESILAGGIVGEKPPIDPSTIRVLPKDGVIVGPGVTVDPATQLSGFNTQPTVSGGSIQVPLPTSAEKQAIVIKPALGKWDLRTATQIRVRVKNTGTVPITPFAQARSGGNSTDLATASTPVAPGATTEIVTRFAPAVTWKGIPNSGDRTSWDGQPGTGTKFASDAVDSIKIGAAHDGAGSFSVDSVVADSPVAVLPDWLGKRPPVDGDWVMTFDDEFNGKAIDMTKWNIYGHNYWDSKTHFTKDNLLLDGKGVTLHFEKKRGPMNDDPKVMQDMTNPKVSETDYATGYLDSYGKWSQRYGYVEARVKLPTAPGLWPTFWMMPDRGTPGDPQWKRTDTANGGMEFDVMEHLDRWGDHRYNIAMHWDGYGKNHHQTGSTFNYTEHDRDGFITVGMLWSPGSAIYYCNGKEMLRWEDPRIGSTPEYFLIEITTGGWDNDRVDDSKLPADYMIDYVRAWQRKDLASPVDSAPNLNK
jgi:beta-glucanase (GH16 family)